MKYFVFCALILIYGCNEPISKKVILECDFSRGERFLSLYVKEDSSSFVVKGRRSRRGDSLIVYSADTSSLFRLDSLSFFLKKVDSLNIAPVSNSEIPDATRVLIYYKSKKVYDVYKWDHQFWMFFEPIMYDFPKGFNPFVTKDFFSEIE